MIHIDNRITEKQINNENNGIFANSFIPKNTVILIEKPYKIYKNLDSMLLFICNDIKKNNLENKFLKLYPRFLSTSDKDYFKTKILKNAFNFTRKTHSNPCILFYGAKFNHSCEPNIIFTNEKDKMVFTTTKDINKNTELHIQYIDINQPYLNRKELLKQYDFICNCSLCKKKK